MKLFKKIGSIVLSLAMALGLSAGFAAPVLAADNPYEPTEFVEHNGAKFGRATEAYTATVRDRQGNETVYNYAGFPLFNGNAEDFDEYLDLLMTEITDDGKLSIATSGQPTGSYEKNGETVTYNIPTGTSQGGEALQGAAGQTALSTVMYQAQSWNIDLINSIGNLMGRENKSKLANGAYNYAASTGTSMTDMRLNPLSGRYDEGYGEDAAMASMFAAANSSGYNGYETDQNGFYILASVNTKHYTVYNAQWFRPVTSTQVGVRSFYEYNAKSANKGFADGAISSFMSSYGRINGVPSSASFITSWANKVSKYDLYNGTDAGADTPYLSYDQSKNITYGLFGNGFDPVYSPNADYKAASMAISGHKPSGSKDNLSNAIANGYNGISMDSIETIVKAYLTFRTRVGIYDEKDANGLSKFYPFNDIAANGSAKATFETESSQAIALQNAEEGIVLLKNEGSVLPIAKDSKVGVYGVFSQAINSGIYQVGVADYTGRGDEAGFSPYEAISKRVADASYNMGLNVVTVTTSDGGYWYIDNNIIVIKSAEDFAAATGADKDNYYFGVLESGQNATSLYSYGAEKWLRCAISDPTVGFDAYVGRTSPLFDDSFLWHNASFVAFDAEPTWKNVPNQGLPPILSNYPYHLILEDAGAEDTYYIHAGGKVNGVTFVTGVAPIMAKNYGYYLEVQSNEGGKYINLGGAKKDDNSSYGGGIAYFNNAADKSAMTFKFNEVQPYGYEANDNIAADDAAIIFVGQSYLGLSGEGTDRLSLEMGEGQITSALNVAKAYKAAGKETIVVVYADYPVIVKALQDSAYVDAILFAGYGGQFGGKATAEVLTGEYAPTGRLVSTFYSDMDLFPTIDAYSIPVGEETLGYDEASGKGRFWDALTLDEIENGLDVDMTNADVIDTAMTYKYISEANAAEHVTYPFGYGLSYVDFAWTNFAAPTDVDVSAGKFTVSVDVTNNGNVKSSEVVQIYAANPNSAYGEAAPKKSLVGFAKAEVAPGETKTVNVSIDPEYLQVWDVNAEDYVVESGAYTFYAAKDSSLTGALTSTVNVTGGEIATAPVGKALNIWEHTFDAEDMHYDEYSKVQTAEAAVAEGVGDDIYSVVAKGEDAWVAIPKVDLTNVMEAKLMAGAPEGVSGKVEVRIDSLDSEPIATFDVASTGKVTLELASTSTEKATINELGYQEVTAPVTQSNGVHDVYLVFGAKDLRAATIEFVAAEQVFDDVPPGQWFYDPVMEIYQTTNAKGTPIMSGYASEEGQPKLFGPADPLVRAQFAVMMYRLADEPETAFDAAAFPDVEDGQFYSVACCWAKSAGVITGYNDGTFGVNDPINREQVATILYRYATQTLKLDVSEASAKGDLSQFSDAASVSEYAVDALKWANGAGIVTGNADGTIAPQGSALRAHCAAMFTRFINYVATFQQ